MKTENQILEAIKDLEDDERHKAQPALVEVNAPLALIQVDIDAQLGALRWVLK